MTTTAICLFAAMLTTGLLTGIKNSCKRGYIIPDRIDIHCEIQAVPFAELSQMQPGEPSAAIRERVIRARNIQTERFSSLSLGEGGGERSYPLQCPDERTYGSSVCRA